MLLTFSFTLPSGPDGAIALIAGGADGDGDGQFATGEVSALTTQDNKTWTRTQTVTAATTGMSVALSYTVGSGVRYSFTVTDATGKTLLSREATTVFAHETLTGSLS
jgi:hypothetical protein